MQNITVAQKDRLVEHDKWNIIHKIAVDRDLEVHLLDTTSIYSSLNADMYTSTGERKVQSTAWKSEYLNFPPPSDTTGIYLQRHMLWHTNAYQSVSATLCT